MEFFNLCQDDLLQELYELRITGSFCDVVVEVQSRRYLAHKAVLSSTCHYFRSLFLAEPCSTLGPFVLDFISVETFEQVLDFIYRGQLSVPRADLSRLRAAAIALGLHCLQEACGPAEDDSDLWGAPEGAMDTCDDDSSRKDGNSPAREPVFPDCSGYEEGAEGNGNHSPLETSCNDPPLVPEQIVNNEESNTVLPPADLCNTEPVHIKTESCEESDKNQETPSESYMMPSFSSTPESVLIGSEGRYVCHKDVTWRTYAHCKPEIGSTVSGAPPSPRRSCLNPSTTLLPQSLVLSQSHLLDRPISRPWRVHEVHSRQDGKGESGSSADTVSCRVCGEAILQTMTALREHARSHVDIQALVCQVCHLHSTLLSNLVKHALLHVGVFLFSCDGCGKRFPVKCRLQEHQRGGCRASLSHGLGLAPMGLGSAVVGLPGQAQLKVETCLTSWNQRKTM
uniref:Uncharacterized protein n=1 Tax=Eptatretus burgeri TaxID=7764 RepID=A0A8C4N4Y4_EPTBU